MNVNDPKDQKSKQEPYTYINGFGFMPQTNEEERKHLSSVCTLLFFVLLLYFLLKRLILIPSYYLSGILGTHVWFNPMTGLITMSEEAYQTASLICYTLSMLLVFIVLRVAVRKEFHLRRLIWLPTFRYAINSFFLLCGTALTGLFCAELFTRLLQYLGIVLPNTSFKLPASGGAFILYFLSITLFPAVLEELLFRGIMLQMLRRYDELFAIAMTSLLFAMVQGSVYDAIFAFIFGMGLSYFAMRNGGLLVCIASSFVIRFLRFFLWMLQNQMESTIASAAILSILLLLFAAAIVCFYFRVHHNPHAFDLKQDENVLTNREKFSVVLINPLFWCLGILCLSRFFINLQFIN